MKPIFLPILLNDGQMVYYLLAILAICFFIKGIILLKVIMWNIANTPAGIFLRLLQYFFVDSEILKNVSLIVDTLF